MCTKSSNFSVFSIFYQYLCSEFSKNTGKSVYLEAMIDPSPIHICVDSSRTVLEHHRSFIPSTLVSQLEEKKPKAAANVATTVNNVITTVTVC